MKITNHRWVFLYAILKSERTKGKKYNNYNICVEAM